MASVVPTASRARRSLTAMCRYRPAGTPRRTSSAEKGLVCPEAPRLLLDIAVEAVIRELPHHRLDALGDLHLVQGLDGGGANDGQAWRALGVIG